MVICSNCGEVNKLESQTCSSCGSALKDPIKATSDTPSSQQIGGIPTQQLDPKILDQNEQIGNSLLSLKFVSDGSILPFPGKGQFILGRISSRQSILPDIDLSPFGAFEAGVSRLHVLINISTESATISDLGSSNGTFINEKKLNHNVELKLKNNDTIHLGRLHIQAQVSFPS